MRYEERTEERSANLGFRTSLDIGMGIFYTAIGIVVMYYKAMGAVEIPPVIAYVLGSMLVVGGIARFYRGIKTIVSKKAGEDSQE